MARALIGLTALLTTASALQPAAAQTAPAADPGTPWVATTLPPAPVGFVAAPGITFVPSAFSEIGYDTNPNQTFSGQTGSGFVRSGAGFALTSVSKTTVATLNASGSMLDYFNDAVFDDPLRFAGSANGSLAYVVQPGVTVSSGAFINYDGQSINRNQTDGANVELGYRDALVASVVRAKFFDVQYLNSDVQVPSPIALTSTFNYNRTEVTWTGLLGTNWRVAPYTELSAAILDYTNQFDPALLNRDANDYHAKAGVRWTASPVLFADIGWRANLRDTEDSRVRSFNSNYFDGGLTWRPTPLFFLTASVERYIGEPSTLFAVLADVRSYSAKATYLPVPGVTVTAAGGLLVVKDIGSGVHYDAPFANAQVAWDYNNHVRFYTALQYQGYDLKWQFQDYNELRIMTGVRIIPDGQDILHGESLENLVARLANGHRPAGAEFSVSGGYSWFGLPDMKMLTVVGGAFFDQALGQQTNGEGNMNGWRTDLRLANFATGALPDGTPLSFGVSGFFANYQGTTNSRCMYSASTDCLIANIQDSNAGMPNNTGPFGNLNVTANRNVNYYGIAFDTRLSNLAGSSLKDGLPISYLSPFKVGLAARAINETAKLTSIDPLVSDPVRYNDQLDTHYYGGFVGVEEKAAFGGGWTIGIDATAGLYYTDTEYQGRYNGYTAIVPAGYFQDSGGVNSSLDKGSFIGTLRLDLKRELVWGTLGAFGQGEYLSYVPRISYNNNDQATGVIWGGIAGTQQGTRIASDSAFNFTTGLSLSVPVN